MQEREDIQINKEYGQAALLEKDEFKKQFNLKNGITTFLRAFLVRLTVS